MAIDPDPAAALAALKERERAGDLPPLLFFWGHSARAGAVTRACLSQWFVAPFEIEGVTYPSAEHFMMAAKARLFGDEDALAAILAAATPADAKALGRRVRGFDPAVWDAAGHPAVVTANVAKFGQNPELGAFLVGTGDAVLVEASPVDPVWGIGLAADAPDAAVPSRWRGRNLLGFALMAVRDRLRAERVTT